MAQTAANVFNATPLVTGPASWAPLGTAAPTNETTALNAAFASLGYIGEDGITETNGRDTTKIKAFGGDTVAVVQTDHTLTYKLRLLESINAEALKATYGDQNVTVTAATSSTGQRIAVVKNSIKLPHKEWVFDVIDGQKKLRLFIPDGQVTTTGDVTIVHTNVISYDLTIECFADALGNKAYQWSNDGKTTP
jgi:hypothetical protein